MKIKMIVPLLLGLLLTGCSQDDSQKFASSSPSNSSSQTNPPTNAGKDKAQTANTTASTSDPSPVVAMPPFAPETKVAADPKPATDPYSPATAALTPTPIEPAPLPGTTEVASKPANPPSPEGGTAAGPAAFAARVTEWKLNPADIKDEFEKDGRIERTKQPAPGAPTGPMDRNVITTAVRNRFDSDPVISALNLSIEAKDGTVTLSGTAHGLDQIGRALAFALDTEGVTKAVSTIKLD